MASKSTFLTHCILLAAVSSLPACGGKDQPTAATPRPTQQAPAQQGETPDPQAPIVPEDATVEPAPAPGPDALILKTIDPNRLVISIQAKLGSLVNDAKLGLAGGKIIKDTSKLEASAVFCTLNARSDKEAAIKKVLVPMAAFQVTSIHVSQGEGKNSNHKAINIVASAVKTDLSLQCLKTSDSEFTLEDVMSATQGQLSLVDAAAQPEVKDQVVVTQAQP